MAIQKGLVDSLRDLIDHRLLDLFTMTPALVTAVDYKENHLNATPLIKTKYTDGTQHAAVEQFHIPIFVLSANSGGARITLPVKVGDTVLVLYSQRSVGNFYQSDGKTVVDSPSTVNLGCYPIMALPCLFTKAGAKEIDSSSIVVENGSTKMVMQPSGDITATCPTFIINGNFEVNGDSELTGSVDHTGVHTQTGDSTITGASAVVGNFSASGTMLNDGVDIGNTHTHTQANDSSNDIQATTSTPS